MATSTATILSAEVTGSARLRARIGDEAAAQLLFDHRRQLIRAVERGGGRVLDTAGDGIAAAFDAASDAVTAAADMQRTAAGCSDDIRVRIGIASGDVTWDGSDCFGQPVITAARLAARAGDGEILVSHVVRLLAGVCSSTAFQHAGTVELKGLPEPVGTFAVRWEPDRDTSGETDPPPLPAQLALSPSFAFVGRDAEWESLRQSWSSVVSGGGQQLVLIGGEAGAGKSRLAAEFARACHTDGALVLFGGCDPELAVPYQPWVQALDTLLRFLSPEDLDVDVAEDLIALAPLLPKLDSRRLGHSTPPRLDPEIQRFRLFRAVEAVFAKASERRPLLLVIDDLHWAAAQTLSLLRDLTRTGGARMLIIATFRDRGDLATEPMTSTLAELNRVDCVSRVALRGLDADGVKAFIARAVGHELDAQLVQLAEEVRARTLGNAFFVGALWQHLVATGVVANVDGRRAVRGSLANPGVPDSIREAVDDRLARLAFPVRRLVELVAIAGQHIELRVLRAAADMVEQELAAALDELVDAGLLDAVQRPLLAYQFTHALVRDTVAAGVPVAARARLHLRVGDALEAVHETDPRGVLGELARHYAGGAGLGSDAKAVYYGRRAGEQADAAFALEEAAGFFATAAEIAPPGSEARGSTLAQLGSVYVRLARFDDATDVFEQVLRIAQDIGSPHLAAQAALGFGDMLHIQGLPSEAAITIQTEAIRMLGDDRSSLRAQLESSLAMSYIHDGRIQEAREALETALALGRSSDDEALMSALGAAVTIETRAEHILSLALELEAIAQRVGNRWYMLSGTSSQLRALVQLGRLHEARKVLDRHRDICGRIGLVVADVETYCFEATLALAEGRFDAAETAAESALELGTDRHPGAAGVYGLQMFAIRRAQGRLGEVAPMVELAVHRHDLGSMWRPGLAVLLAELGRVDEARRLFEDLARDQFTPLPRDALWPATVAFLAEVCVAVGDRHRAELLYREMTGFANENLMVGLTICLGPADRLLGGLAALLGREAEADAHFEAAVALAEASEAPSWLAETRYDWARHLASNGQPLRAHQVAQAALHAAETLDMVALAERCRTLVVPAAVAAPDLPDRLSMRELDVLRLIAAGCSNREIGDRLSISGNTAANHVRAILQKTGCSNRAEAAAYAAQHGLLVAAP